MVIIIRIFHGSVNVAPHSELSLVFNWHNRSIEYYYVRFARTIMLDWMVAFRLVLLERVQYEKQFELSSKITLLSNTIK